MIDPISGLALNEALSGITAEMTGMTMSQAWSSQGFQDPVSAGYDVDFGVKVVTIGDDKPAISGDTDNSVSSSEESDPVDAFSDYVEDNPDVSDVTGGTVLGSKAGTFAFSLLEKTDPLTQVEVATAVAIVAVPIEKAYVAISQALGVSMDAAELDVETKQVFANSIAATPGLVYDAAQDLVTAWWDGVHILFPRKTVEAVEDALFDLGVDVGMQEAESSFLDGELIFGVGTVAIVPENIAPGSPWRFVISGGTVGCINKKLAVTASANSFTYSDYEIWDSSGTKYNERTGDAGSFTYDEKTVYYHYNSLSSNYDPDRTSHVINDVEVTEGGGSASANSARLAWSMVYGTVGPAGDYPEGTEPSQAEKYTSSSIPSAGGIATSDSTTEDVVSITLPEDPYNTKDSRNDPVTTPTDEETVDTLPHPPIPLPIPDTNVSNPDVPLVNSSVIDSALVDELVEELANTLDPQPPQSSGLIPFPFMPGVPVDPSDPSSGSSYPSIVPASGSGFIHVYNPTPAEFVSFGNWLWVTYADATIDKIWNNPFDGVLGAHELYATPSNDGTDNIRSGFLVCPTTAALVRQRYTEIDCGSIIIPEFYGNYLDYSPYSQAYVYLPFIGIVEVSIDDFVGHAVNIRYRVDAYNGSCIAMIYVAKQGYRNLCYQFAGNCAVEVPLAGGSQAAIKAGMMQAEAYATAGVQSAGLTGIAQALGGLAGGLAHGGLAGALGGLASGAISGLANYGAAKIQAGATREAARVANKSSVQHSGTFGASHGAMGLKIPFVMIRNPIQVKVVNYNDDYGFPAHKRVIIGGCTGYLRVREVNVISPHATNEEKIAIEEALKAGVYVT